MHEKEIVIIHAMQVELSYMKQREKAFKCN